VKTSAGEVEGGKRGRIGKAEAEFPLQNAWEKKPESRGDVCPRYLRKKNVEELWKKKKKQRNVFTWQKGRRWERESSWP